ncbi:MAG: hypothetical protein NVSMB47_04720 [Polyangiales bacterium]
MVKGRVLLVEDDPALSDVMCEAIVAEGYAVTGVASTAAARAAMSDEQHQVIVLDLMLHGETSESLLQELSERHDAPPTLLVSASRTAPEVARRFGVVLLAKPFDLDRLLAAIEHAAAG